MNIEKSDKPSISTKNIALWASGTGSNALKIIEYFKDRTTANCPLLVSNKVEAPALEMAASFGLQGLVINRQELKDPDYLLEKLAEYKIDLIVLAGFLWLIPPYLVQAYPGRIINIHPSLLPKYGGKGMYGKNVHRAVKENGEKESGITIHYVNEAYDEGAIIFQASCLLEETDSVDQIARKVQVLEHQHFAPQIERILLNMN